MKSKKHNIILDLAIAVLCSLMLMLTFMHAARSVSGTSQDNRVFDNLWILQNYDETAFAEYDVSLCLPDIIAYKKAGAYPRALFADSELCETVYSILSDVITDIFSDISICRDNGITYDEACDRVRTANSYIFFEYADELPFPYIFSFSTDKNTISESMCSPSKAVYISRIAILLDEDGDTTTYECYCFDSSGNAYSFVRQDGEPFVLSNADAAHLDAYADEFSKCEFFGNMTAKYDGALIDSLDIMLGGIEYSCLSSQFSIDSLSLSSDDSASELLRIFDMNPEKVSSYVEYDKTTAYIGAGERLVISSSGSLEFTSGDNPLSIKKILGFSSGSSKGHSMFEMLKATNVMIDKLSAMYPELFGKSAKPKLTSAYKNSEGNPVFEYSYYYNGIKIDTGTAYKFVFGADGLTEFYANAAAFSPVLQKSATLSKQIIYKRLSEKDSLAGIKRIIPLYSQDANGIYSISWSLN